LRRVSTKASRIPPANKDPKAPAHQGTQHPSTHTYRLLIIKEQASFGCEPGKHWQRGAIIQRIRAASTPLGASSRHAGYNGRFSADNTQAAVEPGLQRPANWQPTTIHPPR